MSDGVKVRRLAREDLRRVAAVLEDREIGKADQGLLVRGPGPVVDDLHDFLSAVLRDRRRDELLVQQLMSD